MPDLSHIDLSDVDTLKVFAVVVIGSAMAAILVYFYERSVAPSLYRLFPRRAAA